MKPYIEPGFGLTLADGTQCVCTKGWHGLDDAWILVEYRHGDGPIVERSVESHEITHIRKPDAN